MYTLDLFWMRTDEYTVKTSFPPRRFELP